MTTITKQESIHINKFNTNKSLISPGNYNVLSVNVPGGINIRDCEIALSELNVYNAIFNISTALGNNHITIAYVTVSSTSHNSILLLYDLTIPDGLYQISELNDWFQSALIANGLFSVIDDVNTTFISFAYNPVHLCVEVTSAPLTGGAWTSAVAATNVQNCASGSAPVGNTPTLSGQCPAIYFGQYLNNNLTTGVIGGTINGLSELVGASTTSFYPSLSCGPVSALNVYTTPTETNTVDLPFSTQDTPYNTVLVTCNLVNSTLMPQYNRVIYDYAPAVQSAGTQLSYSPFPDFFDCQDGFYNTITVNFVDENEAPVPIRDPTMSVTLLLRPKQIGDAPTESDLGSRKMLGQQLVPPPNMDDVRIEQPLSFQKRRRFA